MENIKDIGPGEFDEVVEFLQKERDALQQEFDETKSQVRYASEVFHSLDNRCKKLWESKRKMDETIKYLEEFWGE